MRTNLEWCVRNAFSDNHSDNLGRCVAHSIGLECQEVLQVKKVNIYTHMFIINIFTFQAQVLSSYRLKHYSVEKNLKYLSQRPPFNNAVIIYPVSNVEDFYVLHAYHCRNSASKSLLQADQLVKLIGKKIKLNEFIT